MKDVMTVSGHTNNYWNLPIWLADERGYFAKEGIDVHIKLQEQIEDIIKDARDQGAYVIRALTENVILDRESGGAFVGIIGNVNKLPFSLIAHPSITSIADLRGKRIGVSSLKAGTSSLFMNILSRYGLAHGDYEIVAVGPIQTRWKMLQSREIDAGLQGVPWNYMAIDQGFSDILSPKDYFPEYQLSNFNIDAEWASDNKDLVIRFIRAILLAYRAFYESKGDAVAMAVKHASLTPHYSERAWTDHADGTFPRTGEINMAGMQTLIETSALIRALPSRLATKPEDYVDQSYLIEARGSL